MAMVAVLFVSPTTTTTIESHGHQYGGIVLVGDGTAPFSHHGVVSVNGLIVFESLSNVGAPVLS